MHHIVFLALVTILAGGCSNAQVPSLSGLPSPRDLPFIHKIDIQQGNVITQDMLARLRPKMDKKKVQFIMGTPIILDTFNDHRWDYLYTYEHGGGHTDRRHVTLIFVDDLLDRVEGDVTPAATQLVVDLHQDTRIKVPSFKKKSLATRIKDKIPFTEPAPEEYELDLPDSKDEVESLDPDKEKAIAEVFTFEEKQPVNPYADIQEAPGKGVIVPPDAPTLEYEKGIFSRFFDSIGLGAGSEEETEEPKDYEPADPKYRDITNQDDV
jgi:outer membrane protein assembly factor BamE